MPTQRNGTPLEKKLRRCQVDTSYKKKNKQITIYLSQAVLYNDIQQNDYWLYYLRLTLSGPSVINRDDRASDVGDKEKGSVNESVKSELELGTIFQEPELTHGRSGVTHALSTTEALNLTSTALSVNDVFRREVKELIDLN